MYKTIFNSEVLASVMGLAPQAHAELAFDLGRIEVTAERDLPAMGTERVDSETLREENRETVAEALDKLPGVTLDNFGPRNEAGGLCARLRSPPGASLHRRHPGLRALRRFTTYDLAEVNIDKSFSSVLYGSNTLGGAINLVSVPQGLVTSV